ETLKILDQLKSKISPPLDLHSNPTWAHAYLEAQKLAYADRNKYLADADFVNIPMQGLLADDFIIGRAKKINLEKVETAVAPAGDLLDQSSLWALQPTTEKMSTSQISVIDAQGMAVSMTASIEHIFGSKIFVGGFLLNNQLTDFSFEPTKDGKPVANRIEAGKRPRSSMAPVLVFAPALTKAATPPPLQWVLGSPGGGRIPGYVTKTILQLVDAKQSLKSAVESPQLMNLNNGVSELEENLFSIDFKKALQNKGHILKENTQTSGVNAIELVPASLGNKKSPFQFIGVADPRREGTAR
ncbi:MAG: gamma-glutamyltransferase, partial [Pseudobdellovibrionaceae bacterium]